MISDNGGDSSRPSSEGESNEHFLKRWFDKRASEVGRHFLVLLSETEGARQGILENLRATVLSHYVDPDMVRDWFASHEAPQVACLLRESLPTLEKARSGDLGEILAAEVAESHLGYQVPIRRLRCKDGREISMHGDDVIGVSTKKGKLELLKGEAKSRIKIDKTAIDQAGKALDKDEGRPTRHSVQFIAKRLREQGKNDLASRLEDALLSGSYRVEHMLFVLCGKYKDPENLLYRHLEEISDKPHRRYAVGAQITGHCEFIKKLFDELDELIDG